MKIEYSLFAALFLIGAEMLNRVAVQGVEAALFSTAADWAMRPFRKNWRRA